jgi:hypothetical protein
MQPEKTVVETTSPSNIRTQSPQSVDPTASLAPPNKLSSDILQPPGPSSTALPSKAPPPHILDAVIDDQVYHLPSPSEPPVQILLLDGTSAQLFSDRVVLRGQTLNIPSDLSAAQEISAGGQALKAQPGEANLPPGYNGNAPGGGGGGSGSGGIFGALGGLIGAAGSAVGGISGVAKDAVDFASGGVGAAGTLAGALSTSAQGISGFVSSLNGIQKALPFDQLANGANNALGTVLAAQKFGRDASNWMTSMGKMVQQFDNLKPEIQQQVRDNVREYTKEGGPLKAAEGALKSFKDFPWESQISTVNTPTATTPTQATSASTVTNTSSTTITTSTEVPVSYWFRTNEGTSLETFKALINELDGGTGSSLTWDVIDTQMYTTTMLPSKAAELKERTDLIKFIFPRPKFNLEDLEAKDGMNASTSLRPSRARGAPTRQIMDFESIDLKPLSLSTPLGKAPRAPNPPQLDAPYRKNMLSSPPRNPPQPPRNDPAYQSDDSGGKGTTIYVIDNGFDLSIPVRKCVHSYSYSNMYIGSGR